MTVPKRGWRKIVVEGKLFHWFDKFGFSDWIPIADANRQYICYANPELDKETHRVLPSNMAKWIKEHLC